MSRRRPEIVAARCTLAEKSLIRAASEAEGVPISELIHRVVVPEARRIILEATGTRETAQAAEEG